MLFGDGPIFVCMMLNFDSDVTALLRCMTRLVIFTDRAALKEHDSELWCGRQLPGVDDFFNE